VSPGLTGSGGSANWIIAPSGALKSSSVVKVNRWAGPMSRRTPSWPLLPRLSRLTPSSPLLPRLFTGSPRAVSCAWPSSVVSIPTAIHGQPQRGRCGLTTTWKLHEAAAPHWLVAVQVTRFVPSGKLLPEGGTQSTGPAFPKTAGI
jgi:hypothetical protein